MERQNNGGVDYFVPSSDYLQLARNPSFTLIVPNDHSFVNSTGIDSPVRMIVVSNKDYNKISDPNVPKAVKDKIKAQSVVYLDVNSIRECRFRSIGETEWVSHYGPTDPEQFLDFWKWGPGELDHKVKIYLLKWIDMNLQKLERDYGYERLYSSWLINP